MPKNYKILTENHKIDQLKEKDLNTEVFYI